MIKASKKRHILIYSAKSRNIYSLLKYRFSLIDVIKALQIHIPPENAKAFYSSLFLYRYSAAH